MKSENRTRMTRIRGIHMDTINPYISMSMEIFSTCINAEVW